MAEKHYKLRILPLFEDDLNEVVDYISIHLQNPIAAENFVDAVETAIYERLSCAEAFEPYSSAKERRYPYYRILFKKTDSDTFVYLHHAEPLHRLCFRCQQHHCWCAG